MSDDQIETFHEWADENSLDGKPVVTLPSGDVTITDCAAKLFGLIAPTKTLFVRGGGVFALSKRDDGTFELRIMKPSAARSFFEKHAQLFAWRSGSKGEQVLKPTRCPQDMADALLYTDEVNTLLPKVAGLINCPVIRVVNGAAVPSGVGYDPVTQFLVTGGSPPENVSLTEAVTALLGLLAEFEFQSEGDRARAIASIITPGLKIGGFIKGRVPADVAEADRSQSGKTYRQFVVAAIYNEEVALVTKRQGGVGSVDESLDQKLIEGRPFIQFDNFRGRLDSPHLEAFQTAKGPFPCRVPYRGEVTVPPQSYFIFLSSNGVDTTPDFANRSNIIRIRKKPLGFVFRAFPEGDLLAHVKVRQSYYLGCIFAVIHYWYGQGQPRTQETRHDYREWAQVLDWIVRNVFGLGSLLDGHQEAQERVSNPALVWLRRLVLEIAQTGELNREFMATELHSICENADIAIPGLKNSADEDKAKRVVGSVMARLFRNTNALVVDGYRVEREERYVARDDNNAGGGFKSKVYTVTKL